ncbi:hypothetical protein pEaSNUABM9_00043 [Erwinia phage pEa_SNUABM_9]|nr:hypothetical protein pEaSNUABM9_00043 [Erwinia phage pEa_SNUABM_9]
MRIEKYKDNVTIFHKGETLAFMNVPGIRKSPGPDLRDHDGKVVTRDQLLFSELNRYWTTLKEAEKDELFEAYSTLSEIASESMDVMREYVPKIVAVIAKYHTDAAYKKLYPINNVFIPDKLHASFNDMSPNYTEAMTYIVPDYYQLLIMTLRVKPFIPVFSVLGAYTGGKGLSQETKRQVVYNINLAFEMLCETELMSSPAIDKLSRFLTSLVEKFQKELSNRSNGTSLSVLASVAGYGSDMMDEYLLALTVVRLLALRPGYADYPDGRMEDNSIVSSIYFGIRAEVESGFANRISGQSIIMKQHPTAVVFNGEKGKVSAIDLVTARSIAPMKEPIRAGVMFVDYRRHIKSTELDIPPAQVKVLIDSMQANHTGVTYELHEWLVAAVCHRRTDYRSYKDIDPDKFIYAMAISQAIYLNYGMYEIAQLLSCEMLPGNVSGYPFDPADSELKISTDRYYPQAYRPQRNQEQQSVVRTSLDILVRNHISPYSFHLKASDEAAELLHCKPDVPHYRPGSNILTQLTEILGIQARGKLKEVSWFNQ